jgi:hypothetical protein
MLWWFACNIPDSGVNEYSITDTSNSGVGKYYIAKKQNEWYSWLWRKWTK